MPPVIPNFAVVRPRVVAAGTDEPRPLDEVVSELTDELASGLVRITGPCGSGKSSALAYLAAVFGGNNHLIFLDEPSQDELDRCPQNALIVATMPRGASRGLELRLEPWGQDELIEYLLAKRPDACSSVIQRLGAAANWQWPPELAAVVLDRFIADETLMDPIDALVRHVYEQLPKPKQRDAAARFCLSLLTPNSKELEAAIKKLAKTECPPAIRKLLRHERLQVPLAADQIVGALTTGDYSDLERPLPRNPVEEVGRRCRANAMAMDTLRALLSARRKKSAEPMAASILHAADPSWRPERRGRQWNLVGATFCGANWAEVNLAGAEIGACDLANANLESAVFDNAFAIGIRFTGARLIAASLIHVNASGASFAGANLEGARLANAKLIGANFVNANLNDAALMRAQLGQADLSSASLRKADLSHAVLVGSILVDADMSDAVLFQADLSGTDLRRACLDGARFKNAILKEVQLEDVRVMRAQFPNADLRRGHLTGSILPGVDFSKADLRSAGLGEIDWEGADLRGANLKGATFHMGSSRSGLVGSPIACEGSKTGFYTDDLEDLNFKRPEEVRKANLRGADLRGVKADGVDFYLVDLRDAKLDPALREQAGQTGAILEDLVA
ncbi:MAG TPA: pentapeptide repeat-containing protein [Lacipirellulaceae bacterium]|nr:pentapeptide repeat-containing protein [Lacipirellulaceae bacterium]